MTYSTNYADLLARQAEIQRLGNMPTPTRAALRIAYMTEIGELAQELKPLWAWWKKAPGEQPVDTNRVLSELSDVLHFWLLEAMREGWRVEGDLRPGRRNGQWRMDELLTQLYAPPAWWTPRLLCEIAARFHYTPDDLARAYWEKTEENLRRWETARG